MPGLLQQLALLRPRQLAAVAGMDSALPFDPAQSSLVALVPYIGWQPAAAAAAAAADSSPSCAPPSVPPPLAHSLRWLVAKDPRVQRDEGSPPSQLTGWSLLLQPTGDPAGLLSRDVGPFGDVGTDAAFAAAAAAAGRCHARWSSYEYRSYECRPLRAAAATASATAWALGREWSASGSGCWCLG
eukprot:357476-Chlamydomonas_euryale.AAC.2